MAGYSGKEGSASANPQRNIERYREIYREIVRYRDIERYGEI